ncbi:unnamed protein product [Phytophthora fragariaefolia]|uniref:Unnamed protein product n=1 Tax=Phytophthora fragariaefolia TaxID=1490495 RepID=A0A9W6YJI9_9STRA|nr:unnamed protein product [Phytophthora fragariaefolia]
MRVLPDSLHKNRPASADAIELAALVLNRGQYCGALLQKTGLATPLGKNADEENGDELIECDGVKESDADDDIVDLMLKVASISLQWLLCFARVLPPVLVR